MSYFVFGLVDGRANDVFELADASAQAEGVSLKVRDQMRQPILAEMLGDYSPLSSLPFLLTQSQAEDTSDSLISPYAAGFAASAKALDAIGRWLVALLQSSRVDGVRLWMTEGFDSSFEHLELHASCFAAEIERRVAAEGEVPSLCVSVVR